MKTYEKLIQLLIFVSSALCMEINTIFYGNNLKQVTIAGKSYKYKVKNLSPSNLLKNDIEIINKNKTILTLKKKISDTHLGFGNNATKTESKENLTNSNITRIDMSDLLDGNYQFRFENTTLLNNKIKVDLLKEKLQKKPANSKTNSINDSFSLNLTNTNNNDIKELKLKIEDKKKTIETLDISKSNEILKPIQRLNSTQFLNHIEKYNKKTIDFELISSFTVAEEMQIDKDQRQNKQNIQNINIILSIISMFTFFQLNISNQFKKPPAYMIKITFATFGIIFLFKYLILITENIEFKKILFFSIQTLENFVKVNNITWLLAIFAVKINHNVVKKMTSIIDFYVIVYLGISVFGIYSYLIKQKMKNCFSGLCYSNRLNTIIFENLFSIFESFFIIFCLILYCMMFEKPFKDLSKLYLFQFCVFCMNCLFYLLFFSKISFFIDSRFQDFFSILDLKYHFLFLLYFIFFNKLSEIKFTTEKENDLLNSKDLDHLEEKVHEIIK